MFMVPGSSPPDLRRQGRSPSRAPPLLGWQRGDQPPLCPKWLCHVGGCDSPHIHQTPGLPAVLGLASLTTLREAYLSSSPRRRPAETVRLGDVQPAEARLRERGRYQRCLGRAYPHPTWTEGYGGHRRPSRGLAPVEPRQWPPRRPAAGSLTHPIGVGQVAHLQRQINKFANELNTGVSREKKNTGWRKPWVLHYGPSANQQRPSRTPSTSGGGGCVPPRPSGHGPSSQWRRTRIWRGGAKLLEPRSLDARSSYEGTVSASAVEQ